MSYDKECDKVLSILRKIMQSIDIRSRNLIKKYGMTVPQILLLKEICRHKEPISAAQAAKVINLSPATVTPIVSKLVDRGYIVRKQSTEDRRVIWLLPTEKAIVFFRESPSLMHETFVNKFTQLEKWERLQILSSLERVENMLNLEYVPEPAPILDKEPVLD